MSHLAHCAAWKKWPFYTIFESLMVNQRHVTHCHGLNNKKEKDRSQRALQKITQRIVCWKVLRNGPEPDFWRHNTFFGGPLWCFETFFWRGVMKGLHKIGFRLADVISALFIDLLTFSSRHSAMHLSQQVLLNKWPQQQSMHRGN